MGKCIDRKLFIVIQSEAKDVPIAVKEQRFGRMLKDINESIKSVGK